MNAPVTSATKLLQRSALLAVLLIVAFGSAPTGVDAANDGQIVGIVTNGTSGEPATGVTVVLSRFESPTVFVDISTVADAEGAYAFTGLDTADGYIYATSVTHAGVIYGSNMLRLSEQPSIEADLTIFETTTDQRAVGVTSRGIVLTGIDVESGTITCLDLFALTFDSNRTLVQGDDGRTVRFPVPATASEVSPGTGFNFGTPNVVGSTVYATGPLYPGETTATLNWIVPYVSDSIDLAVDNAYPTGSVRVLIPVDSATFGDEIAVDGDGFVDDGVVTLGGVDYHVWSVPDIAAEQSVTFEIQGLPEVVRETNRLRTFEPLLVVITVIVGGAAIVAWTVYRRNLLHLRPVTVAAAAATPLAERREVLVAHLRLVEQEHATGAIDELTYSSERRAILQELRSISRQMRGIGDDE